VQGEYKLIKDVDTGRVFLFNLKEDIGESKNLADEKPELAKRMYDIITAYLKRFGWDEGTILNGKRKRPHP